MGGEEEAGAAEEGGRRGGWAELLREDAVVQAAVRALTTLLEGEADEWSVRTVRDEMRNEGFEAFYEEIWVALRSIADQSMALTWHDGRSITVMISGGRVHKIHA